jgi:thiosulfate/3-mercaptopyruvate sulfurtransferase
MEVPEYKTLINVDQLEHLLGQPDMVILDCRFSLLQPDLGRQLYLKHHIPGAYFMDINLDLSSPVVKGVTGRHPLPDPEVITFSLRSAGLNPDSQVIVYDQHNGMYASRAWWILHWLGHDKAAVLDGGYAAWESKNLPADNQWPAPKEGTFRFESFKLPTFSLNDIIEKSPALIDSREYARFTGEIEKIDPVAGHIPGAVCIPYMDNTDAEGFWKSAAQLKEKFKAIESTDYGTPVFYCGSGVTACHNILAYKIATGKDASLYPGSYSEWINYYPVATGG